MKKFSLGMLFAAVTLIGGCQSTEMPKDENIENVDVEVSDSVESKDDVLANLSEILGEEVYSIKTTYYDASLFRHLSLDDPYWETTGLQTQMIESAQTVFVAELEDEVNESEETDELETDLVDNLDEKEEVATENSSSNNNGGSTSSSSSSNNNSGSTSSSSSSNNNSGSTSSSSSSNNNSGSTSSSSSSNNNSGSTSSSSSSNNNSGSTSSSSSSNNNSGSTSSSSSSNNNSGSTSSSSSSNNNSGSTSSSSSSNNNSGSTSSTPQPTTPPVVEETKKPVDILDWNYIKSTLIAKGQSLGMIYETSMTRELDGYESPYQSSFMTVSNEKVIGYISELMEYCASHGRLYYNLEMVVQADGNVLIYLIR